LVQDKYQGTRGKETCDKRGLIIIIIIISSGRGVKLTTHLHLVPMTRMCGAIPPLPQYIFMAWFLVKHRDNFTFALTTTTKINVGLRRNTV